MRATALLAKANLYRAGPIGGLKKHIKRGAKGLSPPHACVCSCAFSLSLSPPHQPARAGALFSSRLWIKVPSHLEDGFFLLSSK